MGNGFRVDTLTCSFCPWKADGHQPDAGQIWQDHMAAGHPLYWARRNTVATTLLAHGVTYHGDCGRLAQAVLTALELTPDHTGEIPASANTTGVDDQHGLPGRARGSCKQSDWRVTLLPPGKRRADCGGGRPSGCRLVRDADLQARDATEHICRSRRVHRARWREHDLPRSEQRDRGCHTGIQREAVSGLRVPVIDDGEDPQRDESGVQDGGHVSPALS
jgi:hypothetical protein